MRATLPESPRSSKQGTNSGVRAPVVSIGAAAAPVAIAFAALLASCGTASGPSFPSGAGASGTSGRSDADPTHEVASNTLFADYAGTAACAKCHADYVRTWLASPMHNMTREPAIAAVKGPFDGTTFHFKDDTARLDTKNGVRSITITSKKFGTGTYRVTRVIGGHHREDYAGTLVGGTGIEELVLPVSWVFAPASAAPGTTGSLRYKGYSVMVKERPGLRAGPVWSETCIFCHNTPPYLDTVLGALAGPGAKPYQGEVVDTLLPRDLRASWLVTDSRGLSTVLEKELARIGAPHSSPTPAEAITATRGFFRREHLAELGIGCEACHLGALEHVRDPRKHPSFEPRSAFFTVKWPGAPSPPASPASPAPGAVAATAAERLRATRINRTCARCHQVLFSGYEPTWEGGSRHGNAGGSHINSGEARDLLLGACASKLSCVECHDPHASDATAKLRALDAAGKDALCTKCHAKYAAPEALREHAHHEPTGEGARCISCHMPQKNLALDGTLSRYHRIGSPNDPQRVLLDRPMECALCHADKSVESLVTTTETWWKRPYDRHALLELYGDLGANVLLATAERGKPHEQAVAFYLLGRARSRAAIPILAAQLTNPYPLVRGYAKRALDAIAGGIVPIDIDGDDAVIDAAAKSWLAAHP
jgi:predicted CXXCH cytochrome family protein